ncbi:MAG: Asp-tRNA(Asn)/Glu-tRNA(Gln) amidotransferase subunit GatC [Dehalococcoidia bacterium]
MALSREEVKHIALLARLGLDEEEVEKYTAQLSHILENFEILQEVDTTDVEPTAHIMQVGNVVREDQPSPSLSQEEVLANAPQREDNFFRTKPVLE